MACRWFSPGSQVSSTNSIDRHDTTEILLNVELNTTTLIITLIDIDIKMTFCEIDNWLVKFLNIQRQIIHEYRVFMTSCQKDVYVPIKQHDTIKQKQKTNNGKRTEITINTDKNTREI